MNPHELKELGDELQKTITHLRETPRENKEALSRVQDRLDELEVKMQHASLAPADDRRSTPQETKSYLDFLRKGQFADAYEAKAMAIRDGALGGVLAPADFIAEVIKGIVQYSPIRDVAKVRKISRTSAMAPKRTGVFAAQWTGETATRTETTGQTYGLEEIPTHELYARVIVSNWDLEDPEIDLEADLRDAMAEQFGVSEGTAFVNGDSVGKPEGILTNSDIEVINNGATSFSNADGVVKLLFALKEQYWGNATFLLNRLTLRELRLLKDTQGNYLWRPAVAGGVGVAQGIPPTILDAPYRICTDMPTVASAALAVAVGDLQRAYWVVDRLEIQTLRDPFSAATSGQVVLHARKRVGGQVVVPEAIKLLRMT
jgi:HK97 family phage major capsid protein